jgi:hypothetical protein
LFAIFIALDNPNWPILIFISKIKQIVDLFPLYDQFGAEFQ